jgi:hypothetical protein
VQLPCDPRFELLLRRRNFWDRICGGLGLGRTLSTQDADFDKTIHVACDEPGIEEYLLADERARLQIAHLVALKPLPDASISTVVMSGGKLTLQAAKRAAKAPEDQIRAIAQAVIGPLRELRDGLARFAEGRADPAAFSDPYARSVRILRWLSIGFFVLPLLGWLVALTPFDLPSHPGIADKVIVTTLVVLGVMGLTGVLLLRGSTRLHTVLGLLLLVIAIVCPIGAYPMIRGMNEQLDTSAVQTYTTRIDDRAQELRHSRYSSYYVYYIYLANWHGRPERQRIEVDAGTYEAFANVDTVTVWERRGYLAMPWIADITPTPGAAGRD